MVKFLSDHPSESDFFGSHSRVADAVADIVRASESINVVGLLGGWGSGKSTVVRHIAKKLRKDSGKNEHHLFTYDAWLHQNDPPRRAFLEALIGDLTGEALIERGDWEPRLANLTGRAEETETEITRRLSDTGKWIFLSLGLVPLGLGFLNYGLVSKVFDQSPTALDQLIFWASLAFTIAPLLTITLIYFCWRPWKTVFHQDGWRLFFRRTLWLEHDEAHKDESILALLTNQSIERSRNKTKISQDPTAIEFRAVFRDILAALHSHKRRLVIVIDNLDRLAEADAMSLWATIRSLFLGGEASIQITSSSPPAIILPIDESAVSRMFKIAHPEEADALAAAFIDKTFDIAFYVNEPVMSDWRDFLAKKLEEAFGSVATAERVYWTTKITEEQLVADESAEKSEKIRITPRKLIKLVNSIAALFIQRTEGDVDFVTMAFYVTHRIAISADIRKFVNQDWPSMDIAGGDGWRRQLVALHFGVTPEKAFQTLLDDPLRTAIFAHDSEAFQNLISGAGAWAVMEEIVDNPPSDRNNVVPDADFVANAGLLIAGASPSDEIRSKRALERLGTRWVEAGEVANMRTDLPDIIATLGATRSEGEVAAFISETASKLGHAMRNSAVDTKSATALCDSISAIKDLADIHHVGMDKVELHLKMNSFFELLPLIPAKYRQYIRSSHGAIIVTTALNEGLADESLSSSIPKAVRVLCSSAPIEFADKGKIEWDSLANTASAIVQAQALKHHSTSPAIDVLGILQTFNRTAKRRIAENFSQGRLGTLLNEADQKGDVHRLADIATLMLLSGNDFGGPNGKSWEKVLGEHEEFVESVDVALDWYCPRDKATFALNAESNSPLFAQVLREIVKRNITEHDSHDLITSYVLTNLDTLGARVGEDLFNLCLTTISVRDDFWTTLQAIDDGDVFENALLRLSQLNEIDQLKLTDTIRVRLESRDHTDWEGAITQGVSPYRLVEMFQSLSGQRHLTSDNLIIALNDSRPALLSMDGHARERWFTLTGMLRKNARTTSLRNLRDSVLSGPEVTDFAGLITAGGATLMREGKFADEADKTGRHVVRPLIDSEEGRAALHAQADFFADVVAKSENDTREAISEALTAIEEAAEAAPSEAAKELRVALGLRKRDKKGHT